MRWSAELEGGALMDVGCYCISALRLLAGEPERVSAELVPGGDGVDARLAGLLRFGGDVLGTFDCAFDVPYRAGLELVGETGTIVSLDPWHGQDAGRADPAPRHRRPEDVPVEAADPYARELDDLARAVREGGEPRARPRRRGRPGAHDRGALPRRPRRRPRRRLNPRPASTGSDPVEGVDA